MIEKQLQRKRDSLDKNVEQLLSGGGSRQQRRWLSVEELTDVVQRERDRADRRNLEFCVVMAELHEQCREAEHHNAMLRLLGNRLRLTDDFSLIDDTCVAIVLPDTASDGAGSLVASLRESAEAEGVRFRYQVYVYPFFDDGNPPGGSSISNGSEFEDRENSGEPRPLFFLHRPPRWKRAIDVVASGGALIALSPLLAATALAIKITSPGPIFFSQMREGHGGRQFRIHKFRTMRSDAEELKDGLRHLSEQDGPAFKIKNDPRLTGIGKYLRRSCVDELPQLLNVLRGEMTLVGPRPLPVNESQRCANWQRRRLEVVPGLTCLWQVYGDDTTSFVEWMRMDLDYMRKLGFKADLRLIMSTVMVVLKQEGSA